MNSHYLSGIAAALSEDQAKNRMVRQRQMSKNDHPHISQSDFEWAKKMMKKRSKEKNDVSPRGLLRKSQRALKAQAKKVPVEQKWDYVIENEATPGFLKQTLNAMTKRYKKDED